MSLTRRVLREYCMKLVYQYDFYPFPEISVQVDNFLMTEDDLLEEDKKEIKERVMDLVSYVPEIDQLIEETAEGWKVKRMNKVDLSILRLAVYEIKHDDEVPVSVAINEAVELAKNYGADEHSYKFVNGILSKIVK